MTDRTPRAAVRIVHGDISSGKTRRAAAWIEDQARIGRRVGGVLARKTPEGRRFIDVWTGDDVPLEHSASAEPWIEVGRFRFRRAAFDWAVARIKAAVTAGCDAVVIDEVGPLEMRGEGFADLIDRLATDAPGLERVLLARSDLVDAVVERFGQDAGIVFDPDL